MTKPNVTVDKFSWWLVDELHNREGRDTFPTTTFSHERYLLSRTNRKTHTIHCMHHAHLRFEVGFEVLDF